MITLREYIANLNEFITQNPEALEYIVVCSSDDEGNSYSPVIYTPTLGVYKDRELITIESLEEEPEEYEVTEKDINAVCIN